MAFEWQWHSLLDLLGLRMLSSPDPANAGHMGPVDKHLATNFWTWSIAEMIGSSEAGVRLLLGQIIGKKIQPFFVTITNQRNGL